MSGIKCMQAMVLAAGRGRRMAPLTDHIPKPMIEVAGRTLVDRAIDKLEQAGVTKAVINSSYKAEILENHLAKRSSPKIIFSREESLLETGGGIARALAHFGNHPFFAINGDVIWLDKKTSALEQLSHHWNTDLDALLLVHPRELAIGYDGNGDFFISEEGYVTRRKSAETAPYIYTGVQMLHPRLFVNSPAGAFSLNVLYDRAMQASPPRIKALIYDGDWLHVGDPAGREKAEDYITSMARGDGKHGTA